MIIIQEFIQVMHFLMEIKYTIKKLLELNLNNLMKINLVLEIQHRIFKSVVMNGIVINFMVQLKMLSFIMIKL